MMTEIEKKIQKILDNINNGNTEDIFNGNIITVLKEAKDKIAEYEKEIRYIL